MERPQQLLCRWDGFKRLCSLFELDDVNNKDYFPEASACGVTILKKNLGKFVQIK